MIGLTKHFLIKTGVELLVSGAMLYLEYKANGENSMIGRIITAKKQCDKIKAEKAKQPQFVVVNDYQVT